MDGNLTRRSYKPRRRSWCCPFSIPPPSPESVSYSKSKPEHKLEKAEPPPKSSPNSSLGLVGRIDPRRILSPGRVSPIDSDPTIDSMQEATSELAQIFPSECSERLKTAVQEESSVMSSPMPSNVVGAYDVRLNLKGKHGGFMILELSSEVLSANSSIFAGLIREYKKEGKVCRIEVPDVENLCVFKETIELMFEEDITKRLLKIGAYRSIYILEVSACIMFTKAVFSCLKYLEAVPWNEKEEDKLRRVFTRFKFDGATTKNILDRLSFPGSPESEQFLARRLVSSITTCYDPNPRNELKALVKSLLSHSTNLNKEDIYAACQSCLDSLVNLLEEAAPRVKPHERIPKKETGKTLIGCVSVQVDTIIWLLEILIDQQMAEDFVDMWACQNELLRSHGTASPMIRYELSRVSAVLFIAMGTRRFHCRLKLRIALMEAWFGPMLSDFGWLQRCKKGLDMKALEEAVGQTLLTLPMKQEHTLFMEWFRHFSKHGTECPNLGRAFQIWWRRSFLRGSESLAVESR